MTSPSRQESGPLREWAPLTALLQKLPAKFQMGLFTQDLSFTCIDAVAEFIAIGTDRGVIYWFDRKTGKLETLACENSGSSITCVRVVSTVEYMLAAGDNRGIVTIFQIPKEIPDCLPESLKPNKKRQVERFSIKGLHKVCTTAVEWSKNGMKLFSGDQDGLVVLTEMDFNMHLSQSTELLNEKYPVVQLSYQNSLLLISTVFRTIIVDINQNNQVKQIGQKERKMLGKFGAVFSNNRNFVDPPTVYATRPGLRIWQADKNGTVSKTLIFKEAVKAEKSRVELLNPVSNSSKRKSKGDPTFGIIKPFSDNSLVTFNEDVIYILNPNEITITSVVTDLRKVTDVACFEDEIFVLEGERNILRLSCYPEIDILKTDPNELLEQIAPIAESSKPITWGLSEITSKLKSSPIVCAIPIEKMNPTNLIQSTSILPPIIIGLDTTSIINAEEAVEVPPIVPINLDTPLVTEIEKLKQQNDCLDKMSTPTDRNDIFQKISEQDFEEVVYTPKRRDKKLSHKKTSTHSLQLTKSVETDNSIPTNSQFSSKDCISLSLNNLSEPSGRNEDKIIFIKPEKNLESLEKAVEDKEKLLSNYIDLDLSKYKDKIKSPDTNSCDSVESRCNNFESSGVVESQIANLIESKRVLDRSVLNESQNTPECNEIAVESNLYNQKLENSESDVEDNIMAESQFNELSKEFVKSAIQEEKGDWILLG